MGLCTAIVKALFKEKEEKPAAPAAGERIVLYVPGSKVYHLDDSCLGYNTEPKKVKEKQAVKMGLRMCKRCENNI